MKRCPECRRDYFDDSLVYCLDDGTALLEGPASGNEAATALFNDGRMRAISRPNWLSGPVIAILIVAAGSIIVGAYWLKTRESKAPSGPSSAAYDNYMRA